MEFQIWHIWLITGVVFFIIEIFTPSFILGSLGIGCALAAVSAYLDGTYTWQIIFFIIGALISFFTVRPLMTKYAYKSAAKIKTNVDNLIGQYGRVSETINPVDGTGRVALDGDDWKAVSENNEVIEKGTKVEITNRESIVITVKPLIK